MGKPSPIEQLLDSCANHFYYPCNLVKHAPRAQLGQAYMDKLDEQETRLFDDSQAKLDFVILEHGDGKTHHVADFLTSMVEMEQLFPAVSPRAKHESSAHIKSQVVAMNAQKENGNVQKCSMFFISAPHSRARLRISREMFTFLCTAYQIPPSFLDSVFPFGLRTGPSFHDVSPLRDESRLFPKQKGLEIPSFNQSGREIRICYSLRSVERLENMSLPWSIRQNTTYHTFDIITGNTLWINIKGNQLIKSRVESQLNSGSETTGSITDRPFAASLTMHMIFVEWAGENWRTYIEDLEFGTRTLTSETLVAPVQKSVLAELPYLSGKSGARGPQKHSEIEDESNPTKTKKRPPRQTSPSAGSPRVDIITRRSPPVRNKSQLTSFSFDDLQNILDREEKIKEAIVVLDLNRTTLGDLRNLYDSYAEHLAFDIQGDREDLEVFQWQVRAVEKELDTQSIRAKALLEQLQERKNLMNSILQYRSMKASEFFADQALRSSREMEKLSQHMHVLAIETKQETVSMRVITLVTLFFLPGTFVATFLSTDVLRWTDGVRQFELGALQTYLGLSVPMTAVTFAMWSILYRLVQSKKAALPAGIVYEENTHLMQRAFNLIRSTATRRKGKNKSSSV